MAILDDLNERQQEAVLHTKGPLLIIAGAGSGKTKTITHRIAHLIAEGVEPQKILAVTFTNKAAEEMRERIAVLLKRERLGRGESNQPFIGTFHALGVHILRHHGTAIGIPKNFTILDEEDTRQIFREITKELELDPDVYSPQRMRASISRLKNEMVDASLFVSRAADGPYERAVQAVYAAYEARLQKNKGLDFDDLLLKVVLLFESSAEAREYYERRWEYVHIDEYQDTNQAQYMISRALARTHRNIAVVGDVDQAIYSWRGADWKNILQFEEDWEGTRIILLEENYRSTQVILEAANEVIKHNRQRKEKNLWSSKTGGELIDLIILEDERAEALFICSYIEALKRSGIPARDIAILFRTNAQARALEEALLKKRIPYRLVAGVKFYERKEVKDVLGYLKFAMNPDDAISKKRIVNIPARGIGKVTMLKYVGGIPMSRLELAKIEKFETIMRDIRDAVASMPASAALKTVLAKAGFETYYRGNKIEEDRWENIQELLSITQKFDELPAPEGIEKLLTEASLLTDASEIDPSDSEITLLTAHAAKGLEFRIIVIAGMEEGLFPHSLSETEADVEEERRLFYVAITRAKEKVLITLARRRMLFGETSFNDPSRFLDELPPHLVRNSEHMRHSAHERDEEYEEETSIW